MGLIPKDCPSVEELAARGLNPDGTPKKPEVKKPAPKKTTTKKKGS
jgi:hypothetical protein